MKISEKALTWVMRLYPPLLFQRIWVRSFEPGFSGVDVVIVKSFMNKNYNKSIFGGTIFTATDPFYAILFDQVLQRRGLKCRVWLKSAQINYLKPGRTNLSFRIQLSETEIKDLLGESFVVKTNAEKNELIYKTSKSEKLIVIAILFFIL